MSRKKADKSHYPIFSRNFSEIVAKNGGKYAVADKLSVVYDSIRRWCNGDNLPDGNTLLKIQEVFNVSLDWLLTGEESTLSKTESLDSIPAPPLNQALQKQMTGLEKRFDEQKSRIDDLAFHIKSLSETISEAFPALHKQVSVLQTETEEMRSALKEVGRTKDLEILGTIGGKS